MKHYVDIGRYRIGWERSGEAYYPLRPVYIYVAIGEDRDEDIIQFFLPTFAITGFRLWRDRTK